MIGYVALLLALIVSGIAAFSYFRAHYKAINRSKVPNVQTGRRLYQLSAALVVSASFYLMYLLLGNHFEYSYVFQYSSLELPIAYKISAFWAGQEGSFLLWLLFQVIFGLIMLRKNTAPAGAMAIYSIVQVMLLIMLVAKSPFMMLTEFKADGVGLNPLLQDPWMVIHPPILFLGYAGLAVPFAYALEGLLSNQHQAWVKRALPWTLLAWASLGAGIFVGGFWAYKVLGWGGYWGWDPVENSSLVPWLTSGALLHLLLLAKGRTAAVKPAYLTVIFNFILILYGTFLTRSGILSDFSTHSFADEGTGSLLASFLLVTTFVSLVLLIVRWPQLPSGELYERIKSREFMLSCTPLVLGMLAALVLIGMSTPLLTLLMGNPQSVSTAFYNMTSLPLAIFIVLLLSSLPFIKKGTNRPATMTHVGVVLLIIGILISSMGSKSMVQRFAVGEEHEIFGKKMTYSGVEPSPEHKGFYQNFKVGDSTSDYLLQPFTKLNRQGRPAAHEPGIHRGLTADLYVAPTASHEENALSANHVEVEISYKPFINLVWLGTIFITLGTTWAGVKKLK